MRYAFIGLGHLGAPLAASLARAGFGVAVFDRDASRAAGPVAAGARPAASITDALADADAIVTCLPSPRVSEAVLGEIIAAARPGTTWIEMSTNGREDILRLSAMACAGV